MRCKAQRTDGTPCGAYAVTDGDFCFWHEPACRDRMLDGAARGGARRTVELPEGEPLTPERTRAILAGVVEAVAVGALDGGTARAIGYLLQVEARIRQWQELARRKGLPGDDVQEVRFVWEDSSMPPDEEDL